MSNVPLKPPTKTADETSASRSRFALGRFRVLAELFLVMMAWALGLRLVLLAVFVGLGKLSLSEWATVAVVGLRFDTMVSLLALLPQFLHLTCCSARRMSSRWSLLFHETFWTLSFCVLPFLCVAEFLFFGEFDSRLNYIAFEYLVYPTEVCCNIQQSYPVGWLLTGVIGATIAMCWGFRRRWRTMLASPTPSPGRWAVPFAYAGALATLCVTTRIDDAELTSNRVVNQCALNGAYSFVYHAWTCRFEYDRLYQTIDRELAHERLRKRLDGAGVSFETSSDNPLDRTVSSSAPRRDWNVVVILEESLGSDYVEAVGGKPGLTPNISKLCRDGLLFENFYATGNRTARALEAVMTSLPPIPTESILKRDKSNRVYTLAHVLAQRGYERLFMTGGRGTFDGVKTFMTANGFNRFVEQADYKNPSFVNAWGVADEDLFARGLEEMDRLAEGSAPFFSVLLTVSNHRPFTYPDGRIDLPSSEQTRDHAVKYADWALGNFFERARARPWCRDTLFVVMGDHGARVYGKQQFPMRSYRVPMLMIFPDGRHAGERSRTLSCLLDVAPTVMGALGGDYRSVFFGRDIRSLSPDQGYALMQHNHDVALLTADQTMTVLGSGRRSWEFQLDPESFELTPKGHPGNSRVLDAVAFFQSAYELYYQEACFPQSLPAPQQVRTRKNSGTIRLISASDIEE